MRIWACCIIFLVILITRRISKTFEGHLSKVEQVRFAEGTENPKGHCDLASWAKGREHEMSRGGNPVEGNPVMGQECSVYSQ